MSDSGQVFFLRPNIYLFTDFCYQNFQGSPSYPSYNDITEDALTLLNSYRAERAKCEKDKMSAERRYHDTAKLLEFLQSEVEWANKQLRIAEGRVGMARAHLRASGILPRTSIDN
jgi:hypothetical protein